MNAAIAALALISLAACAELSPRPTTATISDVGCDTHNCTTEGLCALTSHGCAAETNADCESSWACIDESRCVAVGGVCISLDGGSL